MPLLTKSPFFYLLLLVFCAGVTSCHSTKSLNLSTVNPDCIKASRQRIHNATYSTKIDFYNKHFSGLLLFKAISDTDSRVVFITETGFKIFDFEFSPNNFGIRYCLPALRKKFIINIFKNDLGQLVLTDTLSPPAINEKDSSITFTFARGNNRFENYLVGKNCGQLTGIQQGGKLIKHVFTKIDGLKAGNFDEIHINHRPLRLQIALKQIER